MLGLERVPVRKSEAGFWAFPLKSQFSDPVSNKHHFPQALVFHLYFPGVGLVLRGEKGPITNGDT
jgi:hypothetical protein